MSAIWTIVCLDICICMYIYMYEMSEVRTWRLGTPTRQKNSAKGPLNSIAWVIPFNNASSHKSSHSETVFTLHNPEQDGTTNHRKKPMTGTIMMIWLIWTLPQDLSTSLDQQVTRTGNECSYHIRRAIRISMASRAWTDSTWGNKSPTHSEWNMSGYRILCRQYIITGFHHSTTPL
jgi:hypothetical protein